MRILLLLPLLLFAVPAHAQTGNAENGEKVFKRYCASCHMPDLLGNSTNPPDQPPRPDFIGRRSVSPALRGAEFVANWTGLTLNDLFSRIRVSMPQGSPGSLSRQRNAEILAFILSENGYPAGTQDLPFGDPQLADIRVVQ